VEQNGLKDTKDLLVLSTFENPPLKRWSQTWIFKCRKKLPNFFKVGLAPPFQRWKRWKRWKGKKKAAITNLTKNNVHFFFSLFQN
jgi:hypothetical protein